MQFDYLRVYNLLYFKKLCIIRPITLVLELSRREPGIESQTPEVGQETVGALSRSEAFAPDRS